MKIFFTVIFWLTAISMQGQDKTVKNLQQQSQQQIKKDANDTIPKIWKVGGLFSLNLSQTSLSNWAAGGDDFSLSLNAIAYMFAFYKKGRSSWDNTFDFQLGYLKTSTLGERKTNDKIDILSKYGYAITRKWNVGVLFNFRSQFFQGYTYTNNVKVFNSTFLSPAYLILSPGFDYKPNDHFSVFISPIAARWTIVKDDTISAKGLYGVAPGEHHEFEYGAFVSALYLQNLNKNVSYSGRLDLFSNYKHNPQNVDVNMSNLFAVKVSKWLSVTWNLDLIYDDDARLFGKNGHSAALQVKSMVGLGLLVKVPKDIQESIPK
jgi:hypothetical protein